MKRVRINAGKAGIVLKRGEFQRVLTQGKYWMKLSESIVLYDMNREFRSDIELNILLKNEQLASLLTVLNVKDNEIVLQYENENFKDVLTAGRHVFWNGLIDYKFVTIDLGKVYITENIDLKVLTNPLVLSYVRVYKVETYEQGILFVDGKKVKVLNTGTYYFWKNAISVEVMKADLRQQQMEISGQEILTQDKAALRINFYAQYKVTDAEKALMNSKDFEKQLYILIQLALREFIGTLTLDELLDKKEEVSQYVAGYLKSKSLQLGVEVSDSGIRDVILPGEMKEIMNKVLVAQKQAQANAIGRREETAATRSLLNTAKLMEDNAMLYKLKEMEYVERIAEKINNISLSGGNQVVDQLRDIFT